MEAMILTPKIKHPLIKWFTRSLIALLFLFLLCLLVILCIDRIISWKTQDAIYHDVANVPKYDVAMVLGTSKYIGHTLNTYYSHRIDAAIELHQMGKVKSFLLSGDNAHRSYNEPWTMKRDLLKAGVDESAIYLDYAGFRTLDSIIRAREIFLADNFLIITQDFHCERALYIAQYNHINAQCLAVPGPENDSGFQIRLREVFARAKAFLDLYILDSKPKFLGPIKPIIYFESSR
ncbi:SanA/YdcF family protein [Vibrio casei]|uniref:Vancomycin high temperature exclusion protein n=1 Tax=Vibrio casei TaxID=673372 RepID=A0A368LMR2_9VIBR|nr:ElyC/SanA/YdcF family protein [Vibrio casei]RCS73128.1 vancomycin high temperature exclusion protein [Vibrio casei]